MQYFIFILEIFNLIILVEKLISIMNNESEFLYQFR